MAEPKKIKIAIAEPLRLLREGIAAMLDRKKDMKVVGIASNGKELIKTIENEEPDVALITLDMQVMNGLEALKKIKVKYPKVKCILFHEYYLSFLKPQWTYEGAYKSIAVQDNFDIFKIIRGSKTASKKTAEKTKKPAILTGIEKKILNLICNFKTNEQMAKALKIDIATVEKHKSSLYKKTQTDTFQKLFRIAIWMGVV